MLFRSFSLVSCYNSPIASAHEPQHRTLDCQDSRPNYFTQRFHGHTTLVQSIFHAKFSRTAEDTFSRTVFTHSFHANISRTVQHKFHATHFTPHFHAPPHSTIYLYINQLFIFIPPTNTLAYPLYIIFVFNPYISTSCKTLCICAKLYQKSLIQNRLFLLTH